MICNIISDIEVLLNYFKEIPETLMIVVHPFMKFNMDVIKVMEGATVDQIC